MRVGGDWGACFLSNGRILHTTSIWTLGHLSHSAMTRKLFVFFIDLPVEVFEVSGSVILLQQSAPVPTVPSDARLQKLPSVGRGRLRIFRKYDAECPPAPDRHSVSTR